MKHEARPMSAFAKATLSLLLLFLAACDRKTDMYLLADRWDTGEKQLCYQIYDDSDPDIHTGMTTLLCGRDAMTAWMLARGDAHGRDIVFSHTKLYSIHFASNPPTQAELKPVSSKQSHEEQIKTMLGSPLWECLKETGGGITCRRLQTQP